MQKSLYLPVVFSWDSINLLCSTVSQFCLFNQSQVLLKIIIMTKLVPVLICNLQFMLHFKICPYWVKLIDWFWDQEINYSLSDGISGPIFFNNWVYSLMEIILTIVNENYYYYHWTDSVFLNGWLTVSEAANCLTDLVNELSEWLRNYQTDWNYW